MDQGQNMMNAENGPKPRDLMYKNYLICIVFMPTKVGMKDVDILRLPCNKRPNLVQ